MDRCRVGFLGREHVKDADKYDGKLVQVVEFLHESDDPEDVVFSDSNAGVCKGILIDANMINANTV
jgi:hypothetical protein